MKKTDVLSPVSEEENTRLVSLKGGTPYILSAIF